MKHCTRCKVLPVMYWVILSTWLAAMPAFIQHSIERSGIPKQDISLWIESLNGEKLALLHESVSRLPASVVKVFTTYTALRTFGFEYRFPTRFFTVGNVKGGVLYGDLYVKGYGDPTLSSKDLPSIVSRIKQKGIVRIEGDIVIDRTYFQTSKKNSAHFDEHPYSPYNALPDALMFNERVSKICVYPKQKRASKTVPDRSYRLEDALHYVDRACKGKYTWPHVNIRKDENGVTNVKVWGKLSTHCGKRELSQVVTQPYKSFYYALKEEFRNQGIYSGGRLRLGRVPHNAVALITHYSDTLEHIVSKTAKKSNNLYARQLFLALGARKFGAPATLPKARKALKAVLQADGIASDGLYIDNGSGLSRTSRLQARHLASLLRRAYDRYGKRWMKTLSIAGKDGTIRKRFQGTPAAHRAWMKTGTLKHVKNIAGYVLSRNGKLYVTVILVNTKKSRFKAAAMQNDIIKGIVKMKSHSPKPVSASLQSSFAKKPFFVQLGIFATSPSDSFYKALQEMGYTHRNLKEKGRTKVLVGPFYSEYSAKQALYTLKSAYKDAFLIKP